MGLRKLSEETIRVKVELVACDSDQEFELEVTRQQYEILNHLHELSEPEHERLTCYPMLKLKEMRV